LGWPVSPGVMIAGVLALQARRAPVKVLETDKSDDLWILAKKVARGNYSLLPGWGTRAPELPPIVRLQNAAHPSSAENLSIRMQ
jgi:hypothetical protein